MRTVALLLAMATTAHAQIIPPAQYDKPYTGRLTVDTVPTQRALAEVCPAAAARTANMIGCAIRTHDGSHCRVTLVEDSVIIALGSTRARIMRHELGHCNGWPADHPAGQPTPEPKSVKTTVVKPGALADINSANGAMSGCRDIIIRNNHTNPFDRGICAGQVHATWSLSEICPPKGTTLDQAIRIVVQYIDQRPARMHENFISLAREALLAAWPCKQVIR
jgi:hypothetical protein